MTQAVSSSSPIRVALVTGGLKLGGSTTFLCNLGGELLRRGIPVQVLSFEKEHPMASDFEAVGVPVYLQDEKARIFEDRARAILKRLSDFKPSAVIATLSAQSFEILRYLPKGVTRVGVGQSDDPLVYQMMKHYVGEMDFLAVVSRAMRDKAMAMPEFGTVPIHYLPYGVPMSDASGPRRQFSGPLRILYLGRIDREQKRVHLFSEILKDLKAAEIPFHWTIAGDGPERPRLEGELTSDLPHQTVRFIGKVGYASVPQLLKEHDVFLLASDYEGLPLSLLEAMGAGLVPVVSDLESGVREVVDDQTGRRIDVQNVRGYATAIISLHQNRELMKILSENARARVRDTFSTAAMANRWLALLPKHDVPISWPSSWRVGKPLVSSAWLQFSSPGRIFRRAALKMSRHLAGARR